MLSQFGAGIQVASGDIKDEPSKYYGGELRKERNSHLATVALALESSGLNKEKDALAFAVLQEAMGTGPKVKWGSSNTPLAKAVETAAGDAPVAVSAFNSSYSDSGLFGVVLRAAPNVAGAVNIFFCF